MKKALLIIALLPGIACAAQQNLNYTTTTKWGPEGKKAHENFTDLYTNKEPSVYVGETAPADTTRLFLDSNEEAGVLVQKKYVTGTGWVRVGSHGVQYASSCASIAAGMCVDTDDGKLYYHNNTSVVEVGSGGSVDLSAYLSKTNTTAFTPTADYHPATMKFVLDSITAGGGYTDEQAQDAVCLMLSGNTETGITVTCDDVTGKINFVSPTTLASFTDDATHRLVTDTEKGTWNAKQNAVTTSPLTVSMITGLFSGTEDCLGANGETVACGGSGGYTNLTEFVGQTAWRVFYSDGSGDIQELALGSSGTVLKSNGTNAAPSFQADATAEGAGYVSTPPTYSNAACTAGQYAISESYRYDCVASGNWNRTALTDWTALPDTTPDAFTFGGTQADAVLSTQYCSAAVTPAGYDAAATVVATGTATGLGWKVNGGSFVTSGTLSPGQTISACGTSSASNSTSTTASVTVGGVAATSPFTMTTVAPSGDAQITAYFNCNSATTGQSLQKGTGTVTIGGGVATITGQVGNALDNTDTPYSGGRLTIPTASGNLDWSVGTLGFWAYFPANEYERAVHAETNVDAFKLAYDYGAQYTFTFRGGTASASISAAGWHFVELAWDYGNTRNSIRVDGGSWSSPGAANGATAPSGNLILLSETGGSTTDMWIDQVIISTTYQKDIYAQRTATSF